MRAAVAAGLMVAISIALVWPTPRRKVITFPPGITEVTAEIDIPAHTDVRGPGAILRASAKMRSILRLHGDTTVRDLTLNGNRHVVDTRAGLPPADVPFSRFTSGNGILAENASGIRLENVRFTNIPGFAVLAANCRDLSLDRISVGHSGSVNQDGKNNTTGGVLFEEGTTGFAIANSEFVNIWGNGIWTHSLYTSPRNHAGAIANNRFENIGRDAIQIGHAFDIRVEGNRGIHIGYPPEVVDAIPVGIDTAGNVERAIYARNRFEDVAGKCIDLDGFHDGEVRDNYCADTGNYAIVFNNTNPDMLSRNIRVTGNEVYGARYGGVFVIGEGHYVARNRLLNLNTAHCGCPYLPDQPLLLAAGIYLGKGAERPAPARNNVVEDNLITGYRMDENCVVAVDPKANVIRRNRCASPGQSRE